ncbi:micro-fibrillar-associated 1 [Conidiobolus coronatus NRRL 28638]|uniref:Micro-fibrillar-associated 1 n=1 Tax=Conidiobolus coronatus (strain ATCC 28846 / CBS 209.66 / NRRL 28638) TaxID=796925 RepID=A0A137NV25_CONC2|nr:micro-fibrillar-associated 1 [Conidiobolus coronatus NRRL 28638]|eukprot:KXN66607.1 micro-fibrillar-associated 1 [Conidiobolus coronatus NRRL 28638]
MTEAERIEEDLKKIEEQQKGKDDKAKPVFMQKYHHKGAFFMDKDESVYKRDAMVPTEGEIRNKEALPKVMQVRNFGMAGQTKYTHLKDQDTTQDSPWNQVGSKKLKQLGGLHNYHDEQKNIRDAKRRKKDDE